MNTVPITIWNPCQNHSQLKPLKSCHRRNHLLVRSTKGWIHIYSSASHTQTRKTMIRNFISLGLLPSLHLLERWRTVEQVPFAPLSSFYLFSIFISIRRTFPRNIGPATEIPEVLLKKTTVVSWNNPRETRRSDPVISVSQIATPVQQKNTCADVKEGRIAVCLE